MIAKQKSQAGVIVFVVVVVLALLAITAAGSPQEKTGTPEVVTDNAQTRAGGPDQNIKNNSDANDPNMQEPAPPDKGGPKTRGGGPFGCQVRVDNRTPWVIRVYVDGNYRGVVPRYGDLYGLTGNGPTTTYAVATFVNAPERTWGPRTFRCPAGGVHIWQLH